MAEFSYKPVREASALLGLKPWWFRDQRLRGGFISDVHYRRVPGVRSYCYCVELCRDYFNCGGLGAEHQAAIDQFLAQKSLAKRKALSKRGGGANG